LFLARALVCIGVLNLISIKYFGTFFAFSAGCLQSAIFYFSSFIEILAMSGICILLCICFRFYCFLFLTLFLL